jgi:AmmeMemoRadiSam system protein A
MAIRGMRSHSIAGEPSKGAFMTSDIPQLTAKHGKVLLDLARATLNDHFGRTGAAATSMTVAANDPELQAHCGIFVSLKKGGRLRGCIGSLVGRAPLAQGVRTQALNAALHDPRFESLSAEELDRVSIEISVLSPPQPLAFSDSADLLKNLRPHVDGVTIHQGHASATFLPQVWDQLPRAQDFLSQLCLKAGLTADAWRKGGITVEIYQVQYFGE